jgi:23S rRNA (adenine2503-C2)-methyltransferase
MITLTKRINDPNGIVSKFIFEDETAIVESVLYKYDDRAVICFSVQSGCRVGCCFCGTGKRFIRNLNINEMKLQIDILLKEVNNFNKIQIMAMSMGEPLDNWEPVYRVACEYLYIGKHFFISTVGLNCDLYTEIFDLGRRYEKFGLQFSLHHYEDKKRKKLLGNYSELLDIDSIKALANSFRIITGRLAYFNYISTGNETLYEIEQILNIVKNNHITISVLCDKNGFNNGDIKKAERLYNIIIKINPKQSLKIFDPAGQDTIGGGCGQLLYVQEKLNETQEIR